MIYNLYSKRNANIPDIFIYDTIPIGLRNQLIYIWNDLFDSLKVLSTPNEKVSIKDELYKRANNILSREHKLPYDSILSGTDSFDFYFHLYFKDLKDIDKELDTIELLSILIEEIPQKIGEYNLQNLSYSPLQAIKDTNIRLQENGIGYRFNNHKIIRIPNQQIYDNAIVPTLILLTDDTFYKNAEKEFMSAFEHFKQFRYEECLTDCSKAFESTMKLICEKRGWMYDNDKSTASTLIKICLDKGLFPIFLQNHLSAIRSSLESGIPTFRNKRGAHGIGTRTEPIDLHLVNYCINLTASTILLFIEAEKALPTI